MAEMGQPQRVVRIGGKSYAVGLLWRVLDDASNNPRAIAAAEAKEFGGDLYVAYQTDSLMLGLGNSKVGHKAGMPVLALALLDSFSGPTLGAFECDDGIYLIAFRDDQIVSGIETWFPDVNHARALFSDLLERTSWSRIFAPASWEVADRDARSLEELLADGGDNGKLRPIARTREFLAAMTGVVMLVAAAGWWWQSEQEKIQEFLLAQQRALSAEQAARDERIRTAQTQVFPAPSWAGRLPASVTLRACFTALSTLPITVPGWNAARGECQGDVLTVSYRRDGGSVHVFHALLSNLSSPPALVHQGNDVRLAWRLIQERSAPAYEASQPTQPVAAARRVLVSRLEAARVFTYTEQLERGAPVRILSPDGTPMEASLEQALRMSVTFSSEHLSGVAAVADGLVSTLRSLTLDFGALTWRLELDAHERLGVPGLNVPGLPRATPPVSSPRRTS